MLILEGPEKQDEERALEVEKVLLKRLQAGIDRNVPCSARFKRCKNFLQKQIQSPMDPKTRAGFRRRLILLNNLIADTDSIFDHVNACLCYRLTQIEEDIRKDINIKPLSNVASFEDQQKKWRPPSTPIMALERRGLEIDEMAVENLLLNRRGCEDFNAVGIVGAEGVGKTALAQVIFHNKKVKSRFLPRIWLSLSENSVDFKEEESTEIDCARRILLALGFDHETINEMKPSDGDAAAEVSKARFLASLSYAIRSELTRKRYLIVLDGALERNEWFEDLRMDLTPESEMEKRLAFALPKGNGGAVLVTGRAESVLREMVGRDGKGIHRLLPLDKPELCWDIYMEAAGETEEDMEDEEEKRKVKDVVVKRCNGHPAAAVLMGEIRKKQIMDNRCWEKYLEVSGEKEESMKDEKPKLKDEVVKMCNGNLWVAKLMGEAKKKELHGEEEQTVRTGANRLDQASKTQEATEITEE